MKRRQTMYQQVFIRGIVKSNEDLSESKVSEVVAVLECVDLVAMPLEAAWPDNGKSMKKSKRRQTPVSKEASRLRSLQRKQWEFGSSNSTCSRCGQHGHTRKAFACPGREENK